MRDRYLTARLLTSGGLIVLFSLAVLGCETRRIRIPATETALLPLTTEVAKDIPDHQETSETDFVPRPHYSPGDKVSYTVQAGDTLPALASRFNTTEAEIRQANPIIPNIVTTLPSGMPMEIPIYYRSGWGTPFQIIPDALFPNGPQQVGFSARSFADRQPGWFKYFTVYTGEKNRRGGEIIDYISETYSISPRFLLALLEYITGALTETERPNWINDSVFGFGGIAAQQFSSQLNKLCNYLNQIFYEYRDGKQLEYELLDGSLYRIDPWQNAATVTLHHYFAKIMQPDEFFIAIGKDGFQATYKKLFGDFSETLSEIPGSLTQPAFCLPFEDGKNWSYTGGPHAAWGDTAPYAAIDFAPASNTSGCVYSAEWVLAPADGIVVRKDFGIAALDLDMDRDERTGWNIFFLHLLTSSIPPVGTVIKTGQPIGHPSCDGGTSTGTHVHMARKYNGEWIPAGGVIPFNFEGWVVENGNKPYLGTMRRYSSVVIACACGDYQSIIHTGPPLVPTPTFTPKPK